MTLRDAIADDSIGVFLNVEEFAETVVYHPHHGFGESAPVSRSISAMVIRRSYVVSGEDGDYTVYAATVYVDNDSTTGISGEELDLGGDRIAFPLRDGEDASERTIVRIAAQDHAMLTLECQ